MAAINEELHSSLVVVLDAHMEAAKRSASFESDNDNIDVFGANHAQRLLELKSQELVTRRLVIDYVPQDTIEALEKLKYIAAFLISSGQSLEKNDMAAIMNSLKNT